MCSSGNQSGLIRPIDIRLAEEAEQVWYLQHAAYQLEVQWAGWKDAPPLMETIGDLQQCAEQFLAYERDDVLLGAISYKRPCEDTLDICRLMVDPRHLRQGIGHRLLTRVLRQEPHQTARVYVSAGNVPAVALYSKHGFRECERFEPEPGIVLARMERTNA